MSVHETRTFKSGNSVALRLPKSLAIGPDERMVIEQTGDVLTVRRLKDPAEEKRKVAELIASLRALPKPPHVEKRQAPIPPVRRGL